jgi:acetyl-CoA C-acetyltransferase
VAPPEQRAVQERLDATRPTPIVERHEGDATVAAYSVVHGRDGAPEWAVLVCDVPGGRAYARATDDDLLRESEAAELVGTRVRLTPSDVDLPIGGSGVRHDAAVLDGK